MQKISFTYRLSALFLSVLMLFSTVGFSMDIHYCGGEIDNIGFYGKADECKMMKKSSAKELPACHKANQSNQKCHSNSNKTRMSKKSCCNNQSFVLQNLDDSQSVNGFELAQIDLTFVTVFILANFNLFQAETVQPEYKDYSPPIIEQDVTVLHQVFLI